MSSGEITAIVTVIGSVLGFLGITGIDSNMLSGAVQGTFAVITVLAAIYTWWAHRAAIKAQQ